MDEQSNFFKWWTIANVVWQIVNNFVQAGGPTPNRAIVAQEVSKELVRGAFNGRLPNSVLDGHEAIIEMALDYHPAIQNPPKVNPVPPSQPSAPAA